MTTAWYAWHIALNHGWDQYKTNVVLCTYPEAMHSMKLQQEVFLMTKIDDKKFSVLQAFVPSVQGWLLAYCYSDHQLVFITTRLCILHPLMIVQFIDD